MHVHTYDNEHTHTHTDNTPKLIYDPSAKQFVINSQQRISAVDLRRMYAREKEREREKSIEKEREIERETASRNA